VSHYITFDEAFELNSSITFGAAVANAEKLKELFTTSAVDNGMLDVRYDAPPTEEEYNSAAEVLRRAAEYMSEHGWIQGRLQNENGVCAMGAISNALRDVMHNHPYNEEGARLERIAVTMMSGYLNVGISSHVNHIPSWNDAPDRTAEDVILALKHSADWRPKP
jgi:hypothetical protein